MGTAEMENLFPIDAARQKQKREPLVPHWVGHIVAGLVGLFGAYFLLSFIRPDIFKFPPW